MGSQTGSAGVASSPHTKVLEVSLLTILATCFYLGECTRRSRGQCMLTTCLRGVPNHHGLTTSPGHVCPPRMTFLGLPRFQTSKLDRLTDFQRLHPAWRISLPIGWRFSGQKWPMVIVFNVWPIQGPGSPSHPPRWMVFGHFGGYKPTETKLTAGTGTQKVGAFFFFGRCVKLLFQVGVYFFRFQPLVLREVSCQNPGN